MHLKFGLKNGSERRLVRVDGPLVTIGRNKEKNNIVLDHGKVSDEHAKIRVRGGKWELEALGMNGMIVGDRKLRPGDKAQVVNGTTMEVPPFVLEVELPETEVRTVDYRRQQLDQQLSHLCEAIHVELLSQLNIESRSAGGREENQEYHVTLERHVEDIARAEKLFEPQTAELLDHTAGLSIRRHCVETLLVRAGTAKAGAGGLRNRLLTAVQERERELEAMAARMASTLGVEGAGDVSVQVRKLEEGFWETWEAASAKLFPDLRGYLALRYLKKDLKDIVFGYGPLEDLLRIPTISEIMVVDRERIFIEKDGVLENSGRRFVSDEVTEAIIERIVSQVGRRIDKASPLVDARLRDGSRVNAVIPPLAVSGPCLTIRKFPSRKLTVDTLIDRKSLSRSAAEFLRAAVLARKNILVSGGTGSGKTTLLNCLSDYIPDKERIVTIEDTAELQLQKSHVVRLETKTANVEGKGAVTIRDLVKNALRMRPDRIVVGECRGPEALDMLQAMNSGHDGSMTTLHANNAADVVMRLEVLVQMAADLPVSSIHRQIASAVDVVVQLHRLRSGRRVVAQITEFSGLSEEGGVQTRDLFLLEDHDDPAALLAATGSLPSFIDELIEGKMIRLENFYG